MLLAIDIIWLLTGLLLLAVFYIRRETLRNLFSLVQRWTQLVYVIILASVVGASLLHLYDRTYGPGPRSVLEVPVTTLAGLPLAIFICVRLFCLYVIETRSAGRERNTDLH